VAAELGVADVMRKPPDLGRLLGLIARFTPAPASGS
jgi:hypothetical protein